MVYIIIDTKRAEQLKRLSGLLIDRLEEAVEAGSFNIRELRSYASTLMDLRQLQMTDPELIAREQELKLIKLQRETGEFKPQQMRICFEGQTEASAQ